MLLAVACSCLSRPLWRQSYPIPASAELRGGMSKERATPLLPFFRRVLPARLKATCCQQRFPRRSGMSSQNPCRPQDLALPRRRRIANEWPEAMSADKVRRQCEDQSVPGPGRSIPAARSRSAATSGRITQFSRWLFAFRGILNRSCWHGFCYALWVQPATNRILVGVR